MNTKTFFRLTLMLALATTIFTSCGNDEGEDITNRTAVRFSSTIAQPDNAPQLRAAGNTWTSGDAIGIFMANTGATTISGEAINRKHTTTGGNGFTPVAGNEIYYPLNGSVDFIAYYPYNTAITGLTTYPVNVGVQTSQTAIDLLWSNNATGKDKNSGDVALSFNHKLSKVVINTTAGDGLSTSDLAAMTVKFTGMNTKADFNLATGILGAGNTPADIAALTTTAGSAYEAIVLPATFATIGSLTMEFALNKAPLNEVFVWECSANEKFEAGKQYTYNMIITRMGVTFTCTIIDWITEPRAGYTE